MKFSRYIHTRVLMQQVTKTKAWVLGTGTNQQGPSKRERQIKYEDKGPKPEGKLSKSDSCCVDPTAASAEIQKCYLGVGWDFETLRYLK